MVKKYKSNNINMKKYRKPKFYIINVNVENLLAADSPDPDNNTPVTPTVPGEFDAKVQTFRIFDDTDDLSEEDY